VVHHSHALTQQSGRAGLAEAVAAHDTDTLDRRMAALVAYARKLTRAPATVGEADVAALRQVGLDDRAIVDANQVVAYLNYVNRVVEGLGVQLEERWPATARTRRRYAGDQLGAGIPTVDPDALPWLSVQQIREVDRLLIEELGIALEQLMENAGRNLALLARLLLGGDAHERAVVVLAGPGGNGGGVMVAARHLAVAGARVRVLLGGPPERLAPVPGRQHGILRRMGLDVGVGGAAPGPAELVLDGLLGYSQAGPPHGPAAPGQRRPARPGLGRPLRPGAGDRPAAQPARGGRGDPDAGGAKAGAARARRGRRGGGAVPGRHLGAAAGVGAARARRPRAVRQPHERPHRQRPGRLGAMTWHAVGWPVKDCRGADSEASPWRLEALACLQAVCWRPRRTGKDRPGRTDGEGRG
jgi:hypothetical protein